MIDDTEEVLHSRAHEIVHVGITVSVSCYSYVVYVNVDIDTRVPCKEGIHDRQVVGLNQSKGKSVASQYAPGSKDTATDRSSDSHGPR
jgi:hypothetical protein